MARRNFLDSWPVPLGPAIAEKRLQRRLSQFDLAVLAQTTPGTISRIERGQQTRVDPDLFARISVALRARPAALRAA